MASSVPPAVVSAFFRDWRVILRLWGRWRGRLPELAGRVAEVGGPLAGRAGWRRQPGPAAPQAVVATAGHLDHGGRT